MQANILLFAPEYRPNLSNMIRTAEFFGFTNIYIYDENHLLKADNKKSKADLNHMARVWTAGALDHISIQQVENIQKFLRDYRGRKIATVVDTKAKELNQFQFEKDDLLIMGPEKEGLPYTIRAFCDEKIVLSNQGHTDCINVSVMLGICLFQMQNQI